MLRGYHLPMNLVDDPVHDALEELPREVEGLGGHVVRRRHGAKDDDLARCQSSDGRVRKGARETDVAIDSLVSHHTNRPAGVDGGIG